jgi:tRNA uridine 5-carboxymethylaminomethyl modification enzyme
MIDILVIGAGHAGIEAAHAAAKTGLKVSIITLSSEHIVQLHCNVSIGGSAKGIVVKEIFALGGLMPIVADNTQLQSKILNKSKGPAVQALRVQVDKIKYSEMMDQIFLNNSIDIVEGEVDELLIDEGKVYGIRTEQNIEILAKTIIVATGTFLDSIILKGLVKTNEGPSKQKTNSNLSRQLRDLNFDLIRMKTGTPPRIDENTVDFTKMKIETGDDNQVLFSKQIFMKKKYENEPA